MNGGWVQKFPQIKPYKLISISTHFIAQHSITGYLCH